MTSLSKKPWLIGAATLACVLGIAIAGIFVWSPLNCWQEEVDIHSGRIRYSRFLLLICVTERVEDTMLSAVLPASGVMTETPDWRRVNTFSPFVQTSPHHDFHGAMGQLQNLKLCWEAGNFTPAAKRESAHRLLETWQRAGNCSAGSRYLESLAQFITQRGGAIPSVDLAELPPLSDGL